MEFNKYIPKEGLNHQFLSKLCLNSYLSNLSLTANLCLQTEDSKITVTKLSDLKIVCQQ